MHPHQSNSEILPYQSEDGKIQIRVRLEDNTVRLEAARQVEREIEYYNLDVVISVGYLNLSAT